MNVLAWTAQRFGDQAQARYEQLLANALRDLGAEPLRLGTAARPELGHGVRSYHLRHSRKRLEVARPRHLIVYRIAEGSIVEIGRVLHDAMELERRRFRFSVRAVDPAAPPIAATGGGAP